MPRTKLLALLALAAFAPLATSTANAQAAKQLLSGSTSLALDSGLVTELTDEGVSVTSNAPATLTANTASFPIVSGGVDQDTLSGIIYHTGGLTFSAPEASIVVTVGQLALVNSLPGQPAQLYGLLVVNGAVKGLYPLFNITGSAKLPLSGSSVSLSNLDITLSAAGATLLNQAFGFNGFSAGQVIGVASVQAAATTYVAPKKAPVE